MPHLLRASTVVMVALSARVTASGNASQPEFIPHSALRTPHLTGGDTCETATEIPWPLPPGGYTDTGSTFNAGDQYHTDNCNGDDGRARDVVYKITPQADTLFIVTGCHDQAATEYDARGWVYEGGCPGLGLPAEAEPIICSDDGCGFPSPPNMIFAATAGVTYYIVQDGWSGGRGSYAIRVTESPTGPTCDRFNACTDNVFFADADRLGDRYYLSEPGSEPACADVEPCPDVPLGPVYSNCATASCESGLLFCHGYFCNPASGCTGVAGNPPRVFSDFAAARGGLDNRGFEGFWGLDDAIGGVIVWGEDHRIDPATEAISGNCVKTSFTVTYYADDGGAPGDIAFGPFAVEAASVPVGCSFHSLPDPRRYTLTHPPICLKSGWVSVQGQTQSEDPTCEFIWNSTDLSQLASGRDDNHYWARTDGQMIEYRFRGALMLALAPAGEPLTGACCDDSTGTCFDDASCAGCPESARFAAASACAQLAPLCGVPAATMTGAVSRRQCDLPLLPGRTSDPRQGGVTELRISFDTAPGAPSGSGVTLESATCAAPEFAADPSPVSGTVAGNDLVLVFDPALANARTYRLTIGPEVSSLAGQTLEFRGLVGDANGDGMVNALDRSVVLGAWTGSGFTCATDLNNDGATNAIDRSIAIGAWTGSANCAP